MDAGFSSFARVAETQCFRLGPESWASNLDRSQRTALFLAMKFSDQMSSTGLTVLHAVDSDASSGGRHSATTKVVSLVVPMSSASTLFTCASSGP
jgi:hypothetical protein